jgi:cytochrome P450 family 135
VRTRRESVDGNEAGRLPPGPSMPGAVQTLEWMYRPIPFMERCREKYGPIFSMRLGPGAPVVMVGEPSLAKQVIAGDPSLFRAGDTNGVFRPVVGSNSILLLDGEKHMRDRRIMLPAFGASHGRQFAEQVREIADRRVSAWRPGQKLRIQDEMEAISFESIMRVVFGETSGPRQETLRELIPEMMDRCDSALTLIPWFRRKVGGLTPYARLMRVVEKVDEALYEAIAERRADPLTQVRDDALALLVRAGHEDGSELTDAEVRDELLTLIMAGYETTTSGLAWAFERLLRSAAALNQLTSELARGEDGYLDAVVKEILRSRPVVPVVARRLRDPAPLARFMLPAGTILMVSIYLAHHDPITYPEPDAFRPERFAHGVPDDAAWIPFGGGVRRCLGASFAQLEMKIVLKEVLSRVRLHAVGEAPEQTKRKRFTFAPAEGATAIVDDSTPAARELDERRRFAARAGRGAVNA